MGSTTGVGRLASVVAVVGALGRRLEIDEVRGRLGAASASASPSLSARMFTAVFAPIE